MKACLVVYDIPSKSKVKGPGNVFRPIGVRINLSCWVVPHQFIPWDYLKELQKHGGKTHVVRFDEDESDAIIKMAQDALMTEVFEIHRSFSDCLVRAEKWVPPAEAGVDPVERKQLKVKIALQRAKRHLRFAQEAAVAFDLLADVEELINGRREAIAAEYDGFFADVQAIVAVKTKRVRKPKSDESKAKAKAKRAEAKATKEAVTV